MVALSAYVIGFGIFTFIYAEGHSYLSNDPKACVNCHVMQEVYDRWNQSSHHTVAVCNDCHAPHTFWDKYRVKGINGWNHSRAFTTGKFHEPIQINEFNRRIVLNNCLYCHGDLTVSINHVGKKDRTDCLRCHEGVGHGI